MPGKSFDELYYDILNRKIDSKEVLPPRISP